MAEGTATGCRRHPLSLLHFCLISDGCVFLLVFDDGRFSEDDTTLLSDWMIHTPPEVLAKNWGVAKDALDPLKTIPADGRYIFQAPLPPPLEQDKQAVTRDGRAATTAFAFRMMQMKPQKSTKGGEVRIVDSTNFPAAANIAMAHVTLKPGALRELHWHPNADEWQYYIQGSGRMTVFFNRATARTIDFHPGDVGYIPQTLGHYIENTGDSDLVFLEMFKTASLPGLLAQRLADPHSAGIGDRSLGDFAANACRDSESQQRGAAGVMRNPALRHSGARL